MIQNTGKSVTSTIAKAMSLILLLSVAITGYAIITLASSLNDAEAVNVAGSMRMQSYRLAHDIHSNSADYPSHIYLFEQSLYSSSMKALQRWPVPKEITQDYYQLIIRWHQLKKVLNSENKAQYLDEVAQFVAQVDGFVFKLQHFSEQKLIKLAWVGGIGLGGVLGISLFVVHFIRKEVVVPLRSLVTASEQIQNRSFDVELNVTSHNEMGILTRTFNRMAKDLGQLYRGLEQAVNEKTHKLENANQSLQVLYNSSQELTASRISQDNFQAILRHIVSLEGVVSARLEVHDEEGKSTVLSQGECSSESPLPLTLGGKQLGNLYIQYGLPCPNKTLIDNFVQILSRAIYYNQTQKQAEQLILMEERATIARELHDSLAQSLSYLKIQVSLLKRVIGRQNQHRDEASTKQIIVDIDQGLSGAYTQLRELLTTFRLTIREGNFGQALKEMLEQLGSQTTAQIVLSNNLSSMGLDAHQQVHLLQLIREATMNAIKHASANSITIFCDQSDEDVVVMIKDDGVGFDKHDAKLNHYGLTIMQERATRLHGDLSVTSSPNSGCEVVLKFKNSKDTHCDNM